MTTSPLISVIIPCYRQAHYLPEAIDSVLAQSYRNLEIIVVNDGSDDNTDEVARGYGDKIRYVSKKNGGLSSARNAGLAIARGDYVQFLDADDVIHPDVHANMVQALAGQQNPIVMVGWKDFFGPNFQDLSEAAFAKAAEFLPQLIHQNLGPVHAFLTPLPLVKEVGGFCEDLRSCEDWDLWIRIAFKNPPLIQIPFCGVYYRRSTLSMSANEKGMLDTRVQVFCRLLDLLVQDPAMLQAHSQHMVDVLDRLLLRYLAKKYYSDKIYLLYEARRKLERQGIHGKGRLFPFRSILPRGMLEKIKIEYYRWFLPKLFHTYHRGYI